MCYNNDQEDMMVIQLVNEDLIRQIEQLAKQVRRTPEEVITEAVHMYEEQLQIDDATPFWSAIIGLGASGEADIAARDEEILLAETDPIQGWSVSHDDTEHSS
jgi:predicted transcriptional regulator